MLAQLPNNSRWEWKKIGCCVRCCVRCQAYTALLLFPSGYIVATIAVGQETWYVARPIGLYTSQSQSYASTIGLAEEPYLRLTLDRIEDENMLFGIRF